MNVCKADAIREAIKAELWIQNEFEHHEEELMWKLADDIYEKIKPIIEGRDKNGRNY